MSADPFDVVDRLACALPEVVRGTSYGHRAWTLRGRALAWERPLRRPDLEALGAAAPGPVLGLRVADLETKEELLRAEPAVLTTPHFDGHASVLVDLARADEPLLAELLEEAWRTLAPRRLLR